MKPGDLVRIKLKEFATKEHPLYGRPGILLDIPAGTIRDIPVEYRLWKVLIDGELTSVQGLDLEIVHGDD